MKKLLFIFLLLPAICQAQIEFGINAGTVVSATASYKFLRCIKVGAGYEVLNNIELKYAFANQTVSLMAPFLFAEYSKSFGRSEVYAGVDAAFVSFNNNYNAFVYGDKGTGQAIGIHAGYSFNIWKGLCANAQVGYTSVTTRIHKDATYWSNGGTQTSSASCIPVSVGVHYKLSFLKKHSK